MDLRWQRTRFLTAPHSPVNGLYLLDIFSIMNSNYRKGSAGTYFYHSHVGFQTVSCSGPLIVQDEKPPPYKVDGERVVYLQELFNKSDETIEKGLESIPFEFSGETNGFIVNGKTISNFGLTDNSSASLAVIDIKPDSDYRLRFIGATSLSYAALGIDGHDDLQVIEADGAYTQKHSTDFLQIGTGQRFSTLLKSKSCDDLKKSGKFDYYIQIESRERPANHNKLCHFTLRKYLQASIQPSSTPI